MRKLWLGALLNHLLHLGGLFAEEKPIKWTIYFHENLPEKVYDPYSLVILEPDQRPNVSMLLESGKTVLGYLSLGEISKDRPYYEAAQKQGILLQKNQNWPDSRMVDVRNPLWTERVIDELVPKILFQHFSGLFLDTLDNPPYLESKDPAAFKGMKESAVALIKTLRLHFPTIYIMMNRGLELLPEVAKDINAVLAENILTEHDFKTNKQVMVPEKTYLELVKRLHEAKQLNPQLEIFSLDYWNPEDKAGIKKIYDTQRKQGFHPYVATIYLDKIIPEPS